MFFRTIFNQVQKTTCSKNFNIKTLQVFNQDICKKYLSAKAPINFAFKNGENDKKKIKRPAIPKVTLISSDDNVTVTTLEEAQKLSKRRDLKLVKIIDLDTKTQRPIYKLMTGAEYRVEELKLKAERKKEKLNQHVKGEKVLILNSGIAVHDLQIHVNKIMKWSNKRYETRVIINGDESNMERAVCSLCYCS